MISNNSNLHLQWMPNRIIKNRNLVMKFFRLEVLVLLLSVTAFESQALTLTPDDCNIGVNCWTSDVNRQPNANSIEALVGTSVELTELYKSEVGGSDSGLFDDILETSYTNTSTDPADALIELLEGWAIDCSDCYISIKDGNQKPALYVFSLSDWLGTEDIEILDFWPAQGAISNIAIWGGAGSSVYESQLSVPEPSTLTLFGLSLLGLGLFGRRKV